MDIQIGKLAEELARIAISKLGDGDERLYLDKPFSGFYVTRKKPETNGVIREFADDEGDPFFLVCEDLLGGKTQ